MVIKFLATLPDILSAVSLSGVKDSGARIKLDVPASEVGAVVLLQQTGAGRLLKISIEVVENKQRKNKADDIDQILSEINENDEEE